MREYKSVARTFCAYHYCILLAYCLHNASAITMHLAIPFGNSIREACGLNGIFVLIIQQTKSD